MFHWQRKSAESLRSQTGTWLRQAQIGGDHVYSFRAAFYFRARGKSTDCRRRVQLESGPLETGKQPGKHAHHKTERPGLARPHIGWRRLSASTGYCPHPSNLSPLPNILQIISNWSIQENLQPVNRCRRSHLQPQGRPSLTVWLLRLSYVAANITRSPLSAVASARIKRGFALY